MDPQGSEETMKGIMTTNIWHKATRLLSCALLANFFACQYSYTIQSDPIETDILLWSDKNKSESLIRKTPLVIEKTTKFNSQPFYLLRANKKGFISRQILVASSPAASKEIKLKLDPIDLKNFPNLSNLIATDLVLFQSHLLAKALNKIAQLIIEKDHLYYNLATYQKLKGNYYLIIGDRIAAKTAYRIAVDLSKRRNIAYKDVEKLIEITTNNR